MKVILLADVKKVGQKNTLVDVANGYAQNVLLPKKLALPATPENMKRFQKEKGRADDKKALNETLILKNIQELDGKTVHIEARANEAGTLFQTIHAKQVVDAVEKKFGMAIPESSVRMDDIKKVGNHTVTVSAGALSAEFTVSIG